jgi:GTPase SAR1 family protein
VYYREAVAAIVVFDLTTAESFKSLDAWIRAFKDVVPASWLIMLLGNKSDLANRIQASNTQIRQWIGERENLIKDVQTSAITGVGVVEAFHAVADEICRRKKPAIDTQPIQIEEKDEKTPRPECCGK